MKFKRITSEKDLRKKLFPQKLRFIEEYNKIRIYFDPNMEDDKILIGKNSSMEEKFIICNSTAGDKIKNFIDVYISKV